MSEPEVMKLMPARFWEWGQHLQGTGECVLQNNVQLLKPEPEVGLFTPGIRRKVTDAIWACSFHGTTDERSRDSKTRLLTRIWTKPMLGCGVPSIPRGQELWVTLEPDLGLRSLGAWWKQGQNHKYTHTLHTHIHTDTHTHNLSHHTHSHIYRYRLTVYTLIHMYRHTPHRLHTHIINHITHHTQNLQAEDPSAQMSLQIKSDMTEVT